MIFFLSLVTVESAQCTLGSGVIVGPDPSVQSSLDQSTENFIGQKKGTVGTVGTRYFKISFLIEFQMIVDQVGPRSNESIKVNISLTNNNKMTT